MNAVRKMQTLYLIIITAIGGLMTLFGAAGWGSYKEKKLPAMNILFRWFITGIVTSGLAAYAWLFGAGGDPTQLLEKVGNALEVKTVMESLSAAVEGGEATKDSNTGSSELNIGMPSF